MPFYDSRRLLRSPDPEGGSGGGSTEQGLMIPKYRFDEVNQKNQALEQQLAAISSELENLRSEATKKDEQISSLQKELTDTKETYDKEKSDAKRMEAVKANVGEGVQDIDVILKLIDMDKVQLAEDGKLSGLDEQMSQLRQEKPFLFKTPPSPVKKGDNGNQPKESSFAQKLAEKKVTQNKVAKGAKNYFG